MNKQARYYLAGILIVVIVCLLIIIFYNPSTKDVFAKETTRSDLFSTIQARGKLVIAVEPNYPPSSEIVPNANRTPGTRCSPSEYTLNEVKGFNVEITAEIARRLGVEPCYIMPPRSQTRSGNWADNWDLYPIHYITEERLKDYYFTQPTFTTPAAFFVHENNTEFIHMSDLSGRRIGVCSGCVHEQYLNGTLALPGGTTNFAVKNATTVAYINEVLAIDDLSTGGQGKIDAILTSQMTGRDAIRRGLPLRQLDDPAFFGYVAPAIDKKGSMDPETFVNKVSEVVQQMHKDGTLLNLSMKYFSADYTSEAARFNISALHQFA
jgi:polar amino acid transport system substrate-binding protein